jgi:hypothetical protein
MTREPIPSKPADSGRVTDAMVDAACRGFYGERWLRTEKESAQRWMRAAISAALAAQGQVASPAGVPEAVTAWVDAKREHKRLVAVYNARLAYSKQHDLGRISVGHEYEAMCSQQRVMNDLIEPMFAALAATPSATEGDGGAK